MDIEKFEEIYNSLKIRRETGEYVPSLQTGKEEFYNLINIVEEIKPKKIMEIGVHSGGSLKFWEQILPEDGLLIGLDRSIQTMSWNVNESKLKDRIKIVYKESRDPDALKITKEILGDELLDFLYIDGGHGIKDVANDFNVFGTLVRSGGIIGFDDIYNIEGGPTRALIGALSHANEWIIPTEDGIVGSNIDYVPYNHNMFKYPVLRGKIMIIFYGSGGVGIWWKE